MKKVFLIILLLITFIPNIQAYTTSATSSILIDATSNRIIHSNNINKIRSVASISKIMTAIIAIESNKLNDTVKIGKEIESSYGSGIYIKKGEEISLKDLVYGLMLRSGNDAALAISTYVSGSEEEFVKEMNKKAKTIGMKNTTFNNSSGLDQKEGNYSTAYDMAILMSYAMKNKIFREITKTKNYKVKTNLNYYNWTNKNKLLSLYKYTTGGKTGYTEKAKRTLVTSAKKGSLELIAVTLNDGDDWNDHQKLYKEAFEEYKNYRILKKGNINILNETHYENSQLYIKNDFSYPLLNSEKNNIILKFTLKKLTSFKDNEEVGKVIVKIGDKQIYEDKVYVKKKEAKKKIFGFIK